MKNFAFLLCLFYGITATSQVEYITIDDFTFEAFEGPNLVRISENFYADHTEVSNIFYKEYLHWTKTVFGANSQEYFDALPDASVWIYQDKSDIKHEKYFWHAEFDDYPVVGINLEQAKQYSAWRTDRIVEITLIENRIIDINLNPKQDNYFSIERLANGSYPFLKELDAELVFHRYTVPTPEEWKLLSDHPEDKKKRKKSKKKFKSAPTKPVTDGKENSLGLYHISDNVSELVDEESMAMGGNWKQGHDSSPPNRVKQNIPNCWTGFRCIARLEVFKMSNNTAPDMKE